MISFLGNGSAFNFERNDNSAYIKKEGTVLFIDFGNVFDTAIKTGVLGKDIKEVYFLITHTHPDHIAGLGNAIFYCYFILGIKPKIFNNHNHISQMLIAMHVSPEKYDFVDVAKEGEDSPLTEIKELGIKLRVFEVMHTCTYVNLSSGELTESPDIHLSEKDTSLLKLSTSYGVMINENNVITIYTGDCYTFDFQKYHFADKFYVDTSSKDFEGNPHYYIDTMKSDIDEVGIKPSKVFCMHIDTEDEEFHQKVSEYKFSIAQ